MIVKFCLVSAVLALNGCFSEAAPVDSGNLRSLQEATDDSVACSYYFDGDADGMGDYTAENEGASSELLCGTFGPPKCCDVGVFNGVKDGNGPFTVEYAPEYLLQRGQGAASREAALCYAYVDELQASICLESQATFLDGTTLSVCQASCDAIYEACVPTNIISSSATDGTSFCQEAFKSNSVTCTEDPSGYFCTKETTLSVGTEDNCAMLTRPTDEVINRYEAVSMDLDACTAAIVLGIATWLLVVIIVAGCCGFCCCVGLLYYCCCKN